jgi:hypothetical protein
MKDLLQSSESISLSRRAVLGASGVSIALFTAGCFEDGPAEEHEDEVDDPDAEPAEEPSGSDDSEDEENDDGDTETETEDEEDEEDEDDEVEVESSDEAASEDEVDEQNDQQGDEGEEDGSDDANEEEEGEEEGNEEVDEGDEDENEGFASPDALSVLGIYHEDEEFAGDRVQLYNSDDDPVDISGWEFDTGITTVTAGADTTAAPNNNTYVRLADSGENGLDPDGGTLTITQADGSDFGSFEYDADPNAEDEEGENGAEENGEDGDEDND